MKICKTVLILGFLSLYIAGCAFDFFGGGPSWDEERYSSLSEDSEWDSDSDTSEFLAYCNKFNDQDFSGILTTYYNWEEDRFNTNKIWLYLRSVPYELKNSANYMQLHTFNMEDNREVYNKKEPVSMEIVKDSLSEKISTVTVLDKKLLKDMEYLSLDDFIKNYGLLLHDMDGWHGVALSIFNEKDRPVKTVKVLIPPFTAHPDTFVNQNNNEQRLMKLHPFGVLSAKSHTEAMFYKKARAICTHSPRDIPIPQVEDKYKEREEAISDEITRGISLLPDQI